MGPKAISNYILDMVYSLYIHLAMPSSDYSGNFRRVVFEQVPRRGFKDSTSLFFPDLHILGTGC